MIILRYFFLICIIQQVSTNHQSYITVPFVRVEDTTRSVHNIMVEINQYPYQIDINLQGQNQYILSLNSIASLKSKTSSPDYRKHPDTVYGVLDFIAHEKADTRRTLFQQTKSNLYYALRDLLPQQTWVGLRQMQQVDNRRSNLTQGSVNLASAKHSPFMVSLKKHNPYIRESIISFKLSKNNKNGQIYFGTFPKHELLSMSQYSEVNLQNDHQTAWKINIAAIKLKTSKGQDQKATGTNLFSMPVRASLSLSQKTLQLPKQVGLSLETMLNGCTMKQFSSQTLFACRVSSLDLYKDFFIQLNLAKAKTPIELKLFDLVREVVDGQAILNIQEGNDDNYHISSAMLKEYLMGIDYNNGLFLYGRKRADQLMDRYLFTRIFIGVNVVTFIFSVLILTVAHKLKPSSSPQPSSDPFPDKKRPVYTASKASGYQMAAMSEQSPHELQE